MKWITEKRKVNDLIPYEKNPRHITEKQRKDLTASLKKFDLVEIPAINTDGTIIAGHQRIAVMKLLDRGDEKIDVRVPNRKLTKAEVKEYNIRSNKNVAEWDFEILANEFDAKCLEEWGFSENELMFAEDFEPLEINENDRLDEKKKIECPECGHNFEA